MPRPPPRGRPLRADWVWTTRPGAEHDLVEELELAGARARELGPALVRSDVAPTLPSGLVDVTFARHGFRLLGEARADVPAQAAALLAPALRGAAAWALDGWVPDSDATNPHSDAALRLAADVRARVAALERGLSLPRERRDAVALGGVLGELCVVEPGHVFVGWVPAAEALTPAPGGRARVRLSGAKPSRAARKLEEAFAWLGVAPGAGELCVDLGAAPGGWSWLLLERRARVVAVDPARLRPDLYERRGLRHVQDSAFLFEPEEPVDWLFCDMAWRPLEVASLLAKWGRHGMAHMMVANFKLPMKRKAEMVARVRAIVSQSGWRDVRSRQLYHDRDEITLVAHR
jgi:23S rRNA (cytidine2498-2'-O)-methyltransferase